VSNASTHIGIIKHLIVGLMFTLPLLSASHLKVLHKVVLNVTLDLEGPSGGSYIDPPVYVYESYEGNKIIIPSDVFFEVFTLTGEKIARIGGRGEGPGNFRFLLYMEKHNGYYYFLDSPNKLNVYDGDFSFKKRILLQGPRNALYAYSFAFFEDNILVGQKWTGDSPHTDRCISVYGLDGKLLRAFFNKNHGWKLYPEESLLHPVILTTHGEIFFAFNSIPILWKLNNAGSIVNKAALGKTWWKKIEFNAKEFNKKRRMNAWKAINELALSGDLIQKLWSWRGHIVVQVVRDAYDDPRNLFFIIDRNFKKAGNLIDYPGYQFCGAGTFIYLGKLLDMNKSNRKKVVEVLQCDYVF